MAKIVTYYLLPYHNPTRPFFVSQEILKLNDKIVLATHFPLEVDNFLSNYENIFDPLSSW